MSSSSYDHAAYALLSFVILKQWPPLVGSGMAGWGGGGVGIKTGNLWARFQIG